MVSLVKDSGTPLDVWLFQWVLPADQIQVDAVTKDEVDVSYDIQSGFVLCNEDTGLVMTYRWKPDESLLPAYFKNALVMRLAERFAMPLERWDAATKWKSAADEAFAYARRTSSQSRTARKIRSTRLVDIRRMSSGMGDGMGDPAAAVTPTTASTGLASD
jgi:hypothetical protein